MSVSPLISRLVQSTMIPLLCGLVFFSNVSAEAKPRAGKKAYWQSYRVWPGDTVQSVAKRLKVPTKKLKRWNRLKRSKLKPGTRLKFKGPKRVTESVGRTNRGRLVHGVNLDPDGDNQGLGWSINASRNTIWGTPETVRAIKRCGREYRRYFKVGKTTSIPVGSISKRDGGPIGTHKSHQSGRDVDVGFIRKRPPPPGLFVNTKPHELDLYKQWVVTKCFLDHPEIQLIIIERSLVKALKKYIQRIYKKRPKKLSKYLRFFPGKGRKAVILPDNDHKSHMHIRFTCPQGDRRCVP